MANFGSIGLCQGSQLSAKPVCNSSTEQQKMLKSDVKYVYAKCWKIMKTYSNFWVCEKSARIHTAMYVQHLLPYYTYRQGIDIVVRMLPQHSLIPRTICKRWKIRAQVGWCGATLPWAGLFNSFLLFQCNLPSLYDSQVLVYLLCSVECFFF